MRIAIDFDETYTKDPILWNEFMGYATFRGHEVCICTTRNLKHDNTYTLQHLHKLGYPVYFVDGMPKKECMKETWGLDVDIWIDDKPDSIINGSMTNKEDLAAWREQQHGPPHPAAAS